MYYYYVTLKCWSTTTKFVFQLSIVNGMNGLREIAVSVVEMEQEMIRELKSLKKQMEGLATDKILESKSAEALKATVQVSSLVCDAMR